MQLKSMRSKFIYMYYSEWIFIFGVSISNNFELKFNLLVNEMVLEYFFCDKYIFIFLYLYKYLYFR